MSSTLGIGRTPVPHTRHEPVMLIGHGSSGTTIASMLIREHLGIAFGTETQFFVRYYKQQQYFGDLRREKNLRRLVREILAERYFKRTGAKYGFQVTEEDVLQRVIDPTLQGVLRAIFEQLAEQLGMARWGDKTPEYVHHLPILDQLVPGAQYIHVIRDGRDVALSVFGRYFGAKSVYSAAVEWRHAVEQVEEFARRLPRDRYLEVHYEELLANPRAWFARLIRFLGIDDPRDELLDSIAAQVPAELNVQNSNKWRTRFSPAQQRLYEQVAGDVLRRHGYESARARPVDFGPLRRSLWRLDNRLRVWSRPSYWQDHWYRSKTRLKDLRIRVQGTLAR